MELDHSDCTLDETLAALVHARRRTVLHFLRDQSNNVVSMDELVGYVQAQERAAVGGHDVDRESIAVMLHHHHLPQLADQGLVEYDVRRGRIRYYPDEATESLLQFIRTL